jgi:hypothetical protein
MKNISSLSLVLLTLLVSFSAFAAPKVGDQAYMEGSFVGTGGNATLKLTTTQTVLAYAMNTDVFTVRQEQTVGGDTATPRDVSVKGEDMLTEEVSAMIVAQCESAKIGTIDKIEVKAGKFTTCKVKQGDKDTLWIGAIPFGVVKLQNVSGTGVVDLELYSYVRGAK